MATLNLGRIKPVFRGAYNNSTAYVVDDIVTSGGSSYICIQASTGNAVSNATYWTLMAEGGDVASTLTTQGDILYRDASGLQRLGAGTSGQVLQTGGSGANPSWTTVSSDCVLLSQNNAQTSVASVSFDNIFTSDYDHYTAYITKYNTGTNGGSLRFRFRGGGASRSTQHFIMVVGVVIL